MVMLVYQRVSIYPSHRAAHGSRWVKSKCSTPWKLMRRLPMGWILRHKWLNLCVYIYIYVINLSICTICICDMYIYIYLHTWYIYIYIYIYMICTYIYIYTHDMYIYINIYTHMIYAFIFKYTHDLCIIMYKYIHIYIYVGVNNDYSVFFSDGYSNIYTSGCVQTNGLKSWDG